MEGGREGRVIRRKGRKKEGRPYAAAILCVIALQGSAKRWAPGCVNSPPTARGSQEAGFTQLRAYL